MTCGTGGTDSYAGMDLEDSKRAQTVTLLHCRKSNPAAKIPKWRSTLRNAILISIDGNSIKCKLDVMKAIQKAQKNSKGQMTLIFAPIEKVTMHPQHGIPQMFSDQLNVIAEHH